MISEQVVVIDGGHDWKTWIKYDKFFLIRIFSDKTRHAAVFLICSD